MPLVVVLSAQLVVVLDFSIVNVALPSISSEFDASFMSAEWVVTAYAIAFGGFLVVGGRAADLIGPRRLFVGGLVGFALASAAGGAAPSLALLVGARAVQGLAAAAVAPAALATLTTNYPEGPARTRVLGYYGVLASVGFVLGLVLGGVLVEWVGWRSVFYVNVPICLVAAGVGRGALPGGTAATGRRRLDIAGAVLITAGVAVLVYAPTAGASDGWTSTSLLGALAVSAIVLAGFVIHERGAPHPLVPASILRHRTLVAGNAVALLVGAWNGAEILVLALYLQDILGYSPLMAGLVVIPQGIGGLARGAVGPSAVGRLGVRRFLIASCLVAAAGLALLLRFPSTTHGVYLGLVLFVVGFGTTNALFASTVAASSGVSNEDEGLAGGLVNTSRQVGAALGVAVLVAVATAGAMSAGSSGSGYRLAMGVASGLAAAAALTAGVVMPRS